MYKSKNKWKPGEGVCHSLYSCLRVAAKDPIIIVHSFTLTSLNFFLVVEDVGVESGIKLHPSYHSQRLWTVTGSLCESGGA